MDANEIVFKLRAIEEVRAAGLRYLRDNLAGVTEVDPSAGRKLRLGYGADLSNKRIADIIEKLEAIVEGGRK